MGVPLNKLLPAVQQTAAAAKLKEIAARAQMNLEERGLDTLFLGLGMATWQPDDDGRPDGCADSVDAAGGDLHRTGVARMDAEAKR